VRTRVLPVVRKEFREIRRDPITLAIAIALPVVMLLLFGYAVRFDVEDVPMAVLDLDRSPESAALIETFVNTGDFEVSRRAGDEREIRRLLDRGAVRLALVIPPGFGRDLKDGRVAQVQTLVDGGYSATALIVRNEAEAATFAFLADRLRRGAGSDAPLASSVLSSAQPRVWYNAPLKSSTFVIPGLFAVILMGFPPLLTVLAVVREKESGSVQQIYVSPLRAWEFIAGKMLPYVAIAFGELAMILALGKWWFAVPFRGSPTLLLIASTLYVFCTVGIGLLVSTVTRSQVVAMLLALIVTLMPSFLFSGFIFPISTMPEVIQWYTWLFPARYFNTISRGLFLKGTGVAELGGELVILGLYTAAVFAAASFRFRKKVA
jgi:ABC-2 type transport system permease protein